ncbi:MAG: protein kinase domain-containing protein [Acidobacteriota bacterium]
MTLIGVGSSHTPASRIGQLVSHYEIRDLLGSGGMGDVYGAVDLRLRRRVALKFLRPLSDPDLRRRFIREAQSASLLDHPNICTIFEVDETPAGDVFIAMACYEGETLDRSLKRGPLDPKRALQIAVQAGRGLSAAHDELIVHCDVKPANLFVTQDETVKILDFGIAKTLREAGVDADMNALGTPPYMAPEQLRGEGVDQRTDVWALGVVLFESLTGVLPFRGDAVNGVVDAILTTQPVPPSALCPGVSPAIDRIVERALAKSPRLRYDRIDLMVKDLQAIQSATDSQALTIRVPALAASSSIAVLPLQDMSAAKDQEFLCDGIAEEVLRALSRIPDLYVASRTSAFQFKGHAADIREIGSRLNVNTVLEGSVRRAGDRVRVSVQLISVADGYRLWCERYDRDVRDIFEIEDEIAEQIAQALQVTLSERAAPSAHGRFEPNAEAYQLYLQGRQFFHQHRRKAFEIALQTFSRAIEISPGYARAYAGIADCHSFLKLYFGHGAEAVQAADDASARALELAPELSDAHASRGLALFLRADFEGAERHLQRAIELDPRVYEPHYIFGRVCFSQSRIDEAAAHFREACAIVPEAYDSWYLLGMCYRRLKDAYRARHASFECVEAMKRWVRFHPDDTRAWTMGAAVLAEMGEPDRADAWVERALAIDKEESIILYNAACVYVTLGKRDEAINCLEQTAKYGSISAAWMKNDPDLDPLRADPRFQALIAALPE